MTVPHLPALLHPHLERDAVVGDHDEQRAIEHAGAPHAAHDQPELAVGVADLEQVAQVVVVGEQRVVEALGPVDPLDRVVARRPALVT